MTQEALLAGTFLAGVSEMVLLYLAYTIGYEEGSRQRHQC